MTNAKNLFNLSLFLLGMTLLPQAAFSQAKHGPANITGLVKIDTKVGTGEVADIGKVVEVHYTGWLYDPTAPQNKGKKFDSSRDRINTFSFLVGAGRVIKGWDRGVAGMRIGGQRTLIIPPAMAYGSTGAGGTIPPNAILIFDVELVSLRQGPTH